MGTVKMELERPEKMNSREVIVKSPKLYQVFPWNFIVTHSFYFSLFSLLFFFFFFHVWVWQPASYCKSSTGTEQEINSKLVKH